MPDLPRPVHLVAQAPVLHLIWFRYAILPPQLAPLRPLLDVAIFHQRRRLLRRPRAQIQSHQRLRPRQLAPRHELVRAKLIRIQRIPRLVQHHRPVLLRPDAVEPVVARHKISAGIPNDRHVDLPNLLQRVFAESVRIRQLRSRIVNALIDRAPKMLEKRPKYISIDRRNHRRVSK